MSNSSAECDKLFAAIVAMQKAIGPVVRGRTVKVWSRKTQTEYTFSYAPQELVIEHIRKAMTDNGLWFEQALQEGWGEYPVLETTIFHESGQWRSSRVRAPFDDESIQGFGSLLTYLARYSLCKMLGIASEDDLDGNEADGNKVASVTDKPVSPKQEAFSSGKAPKPDKTDYTPDARAWGQKAILALDGIKSLKDFDAWHTTECRARIAKLQQYDKELHGKLIEKVHRKLSDFNPINAG